MNKRLQGNSAVWCAIVAAAMLVLAGASGAWAQTPGSATVRLVDSLSTENARAGDSFTATLAEPLVMNGRVVAPKDARVTGRVVEAVSSGRLKKPALITLQLDSVQSSSGRYPLATEAMTIKQDSHTTRNVVIIGGTTAAGAVIGGVAGGGKGAAIGAASGAGVGTLAAFLTGKKEISLPSETALTFHLTSVNVSARDLSRPPRVGEAYNQTQGREANDRRGRDRGGREAGYQEDRDRERARDAERENATIFTPRQRTIITDYFRNSRGNLPPGLAKRDRLPPGLEKQLRERGTLPPGLQKRFAPLPNDLERQLPRLPAGYRRGVVAGNVILMEEATSVIVDIIRNVMQ